VANASVEKLKALGLRHGEKAVVGLTAMLCVMFLFLAATRPTIELTPDQVKQAATSADSNLNRNQPPEDILKGLEEQGIKNPGFEKTVEEQEKNHLVAANYRAHQLWVSPEPGAGLIRDQPELIAPTELAAYPGRGGVVMYATDENGARIPDPDAVLDADTLARRESRTRSAMGEMSSSGARSGRGRMNQAEKEKEEKTSASSRRSVAWPRSPAPGRTMPRPRTPPPQARPR